MSALKAILRFLVGEEVLGYLDYLRFPTRASAWGGPFNGQTSRIELFHDLIARISPVAIVETGTYLGTTTELFATTSVPVFTIELQKRHYGYARARLRHFHNVAVRLGDSRQQLRVLLAGPLHAYREENIVFYLDAHWGQDLPLREEIDVIFSNFNRAIVMIDDFQVPDDSGYGFDDFGAGNCLTESYIATLAQSHGLACFFPSVKSSEESGACRGCTVLCKESVHALALTSSPYLRQVQH